MPNWCNNSITIKGPKAKIEALYQEIKGKNKMLDILRPMPQELRETTSPTPEKGSANYKGPQPRVDGYDNWYDWAVNNWGTKWDVDVDNLELNQQVAGSDEAEINGWFDSAWAPPLHALDYYIEKNPDVSIRCMYYEGGCDFMGEWEDGADDCLAPSDYKSSDLLEAERHTLLGQLDEQFGIGESMAEYEQDQFEEVTNA
ncbi:MAG: hypothetical protein CMQ27_09015 [Gammaproteobacteria bacterium]|nr:hypothetical protein [Gammaproteobacteria bacterium]|tara:strand:- start:678 stop:1277 length:600 start_codon:yes stop_codon:yes gene_type:complete